jgi:hypothetical protein
MTLRDLLREELRPAAGEDELGDIILEETLRIVDLTNEGLGQDVPEAARADLRRLHGDRLSSIRDLVRTLREKADEMKYDDQQLTREVLRQQVRERVARESSD